MSEPTPADPADEIDVKEARLEHPSGFLRLTRSETVPIVVDALLDLPPGREFNKTEIAERAGVTRQSVTNHVDVLFELEVIEEVPETSPQRYRVADSDVVRTLFELNSALNSVR